MKRITLLILLFLYSLLLSANISVSAFVDKNRVAVGEAFSLTIEAKGENVPKFTIPDMPKMPFNVHGSRTSSQSSMSYSGGKMTSQRTEQIIYTLSADSEGNLQIPPISVTINKQKFTTQAIPITVTKASVQQQQQPRGNTQSSEQAGSEIFILATAEKTEVYRNEMIVVHFKLYTQSQLQNVSFASEPAFSGFWKEELYQAQRIQMQREVYQGRQYNTLLLRSLALFPSREGNLTIPPLELNIDVVIPSRSFFDFGSVRSVRVASQPIDIKVNPLPYIDSSRNFIGAVGKFDITSSLSANKGEVGKPLTYRITLSGTGNFNQTLTPTLPEARGIRYLPPETTDEKNQSGNVFSGKRTFIYPVLLTESGTITIPEMEISWFDPALKRYQSKTLKSETIIVSQSDQQVITTPGSQQTIRFFGRDIEFIITNPSKTNFKYFYNSYLYWIALLLLPISLIVHYYFILVNQKMDSDLLYRRNRRAIAIIKKYLRDANKYAKENSIDFYNSAHIGLSHFLTDKLNLPRGSVERAIFQTLKERNISDSLVSELQKSFQKINLVKFGNVNIESLNIVEDARIISNLVQNLITELKNSGAKK